MLLRNFDFGEGHVNGSRSIDEKKKFHSYLFPFFFSHPKSVIICLLIFYFWKVKGDGGGG